MTATVARSLMGDPGEVFQDIGSIIEVNAERGELRVQNERGTFPARRAVCCLVEPEEGDEVLFTGRLGGELYVLGVLRREGHEPRRLSVPEGVVITAKDGKIAIAASRGVDVVSSKDISMTSSELRMQASEGIVLFENLSYLGIGLVAELEQAKTVVGKLESVADRLVQRVKHAYRFIEELEQVRAGAIDMAAIKILRMHGEHVVSTAKKLIKLDGEQIHIG